MNHCISVSQWCQKAENDLKTAYHEIEHEDPALDTVCFHAQQTAEKYLKAYLIYSNIEIPRTNVLIQIIKRCMDVDSAFFELIDKDIDDLTEYAVEIRYADDFFIPDINEARDAVKKAEIVKKFVLSRISIEEANNP